MEVYVLEERSLGEWFVAGVYTSYELAEQEAKDRRLFADSYSIAPITLNAPAE